MSGWGTTTLSKDSRDKVLSETWTEVSIRLRSASHGIMTNHRYFNWFIVVGKINPYDSPHNGKIGWQIESACLNCTGSRSFLGQGEVYWIPEQVNTLTVFCYGCSEPLIRVSGLKDDNWRMSIPLGLYNRKGF